MITVDTNQEARHRATELGVSLVIGAYSDGGGQHASDPLHGWIRRPAAGTTEGPLWEIGLCSRRFLTAFSLVLY